MSIRDYMNIVAQAPAVAAADRLDEFSFKNLFARNKAPARAEPAAPRFTPAAPQRWTPPPAAGGAPPWRGAGERPVFGRKQPASTTPAAAPAPVAPAAPAPDVSRMLDQIKQQSPAAYATLAQHIAEVLQTLPVAG